MCKPCNGYANYETWCVSLWIDNDQGQYEYWREKARMYEPRTSQLADELKNEHNELMPELHGVYQDLLRASLDSVDWYEIAENMMNEIKEEEKQEE